MSFQSVQEPRGLDSGLLPKSKGTGTHEFVPASLKSTCTTVSFVSHQAELQSHGRAALQIYLLLVLCHYHVTLILRTQVGPLSKLNLLCCSYDCCATTETRGNSRDRLEEVGPHLRLLISVKARVVPTSFSESNVIGDLVIGSVALAQDIRVPEHHSPAITVALSGDEEIGHWTPPITSQTQTRCA